MTCLLIININEHFPAFLLFLMLSSWIYALYIYHLSLSGVCSSGRIQQQIYTMAPVVRRDIQTTVILQHNLGCGSLYKASVVFCPFS